MTLYGTPDTAIGYIFCALQAPGVGAQRSVYLERAARAAIRFQLIATNGRDVGRIPTVGLASVPLGTVTLGGQFGPLADLVEPLTEDAIFGFKCEEMYALGGVAGSVSSGQTYALAAAYGNGPRNFAAGYFHANLASDFVLTSSGVSLAPAATAPTTGLVPVTSQSNESNGRQPSSATSLRARPA